MCMCLKDHLDAKERKQDKCPLEIPLDFEEDVFDDEVQRNKAIPLSDEEIALDASSKGTLSPGGLRCSSSRMKSTPGSTIKRFGGETLLCGLLRISPSNAVIPQYHMHTKCLADLKHQVKEQRVSNSLQSCMVGGYIDAMAFFELIMTSVLWAKTAYVGNLLSSRKVQQDTSSDQATNREATTQGAKKIGVDPIVGSFPSHSTFRYLTPPVDQWLKIVGFNLEGAAAKWFKWMTRNAGVFISRPTTLGDAFSLALITEARLDYQAAPVADEDELNLLRPDFVLKEFISQTDEFIVTKGQIVGKTRMVHMEDLCIDEDQHGSVRSIGVTINSDVADFGSKVPDSGSLG
nr:protein kinase, catalytic domain-containing protein [Tanacetum cinerariifolium]